MSPLSGAAALGSGAAALFCNKCNKGSLWQSITGAKCNSLAGGISSLIGSKCTGTVQPGTGSSDYTGGITTGTPNTTAYDSSGNAIGTYDSDGNFVSNSSSAKGGLIQARVGGAIGCKSTRSRGGLPG
jgi:hypothetical protein